MSISLKTQYQAYNMAAQTIGKTRQVVMLYDGAIRYTQQAIEAIKENRIEDRYNLLIKASNVIMGLQACLDFESGGQVAVLLHDYYSSIDARLLTVHRTNSIETCEQVINELKEMRDAWELIDKGEQGSNVDAAAVKPVESPSRPISNSVIDDIQNVFFSA